MSLTVFHRHDLALVDLSAEVGRYWALWHCSRCLGSMHNGRLCVVARLVCPLWLRRRPVKECSTRQDDWTASQDVETQVLYSFVAVPYRCVD